MERLRLVEKRRSTEVDLAKFSDAALVAKGTTLPLGDGTPKYATSQARTPKRRAESAPATPLSWLSSESGYGRRAPNPKLEVLKALGAFRPGPHTDGRKADLRNLCKSGFRKYSRQDQ